MFQASSPVFTSVMHSPPMVAERAYPLSVRTIAPQAWAGPHNCSGSPSRGSEVLVKILGKEFDGILGCDYFSAYHKWLFTRIYGRIVA